MRHEERLAKRINALLDDKMNGFRTDSGAKLKVGECAINYNDWLDARRELADIAQALRDRGEQVELLLEEDDHE